MFLCCLITYSCEQVARCDGEAQRFRLCFTYLAEKCSAKSCDEEDGINKITEIEQMIKQWHQLLPRLLLLTIYQ